MSTHRFHPALVFCSVLLAVMAGGCDGDGAEVSFRQPVEDISGVWSANAAVTSDPCGLSSTVKPIGFNMCGIAQTDVTLAVNCHDQCENGCLRATGRIQGGDVTFTSIRQIVLGPECTLLVAEDDAAILSDGAMIGGAVLTVSAVGDCPGQYPCIMNGLFTLKKFPPDVLFPDCVSICP